MGGGALSGGGGGMNIGNAFFSTLLGAWITTFSVSIGDRLVGLVEVMDGGLVGLGGFAPPCFVKVSLFVLSGVSGEFTILGGEGARRFFVVFFFSMVTLP